MFVSIYQGMKQRCYNKKGHNYKYYGGKGVVVCDEWLDDINIFIEWGKVNGYKRGLQLDRIDNNGDYAPENCRFVTSRVNNRNKSNSKWWFIDGVRYSSSTVAAKKLGLSQNMIYAWCEGTKYEKPLDGCYTKLKYIALF